jgi:hypothetical protein
MNSIWGQPGSFGWRRSHFKDGVSQEVNEFNQLITSLLERVFFDGSSKRFSEIREAYNQFLASLKWW